MSRLEKEIKAAGSQMEITGEGFSMAFIFPPDFIGFDGHFPDNPILPAVVQIMAGACAAMAAEQTDFTTRNVSRAKFVRPILPNEELVISGSIQHKNGNRIAPITIRVAEELAATFTLTLGEQ